MDFSEIDDKTLEIIKFANSIEIIQENWPNNNNYNSIHLPEYTDNNSDDKRLIDYNKSYNSDNKNNSNNKFYDEWVSSIDEYSHSDDSTIHKNKRGRKRKRSDTIKKCMEIECVKSATSNTDRCKYHNAQLMNKIKKISITENDYREGILQYCVKNDISDNHVSKITQKLYCTMHPTRKSYRSGLCSACYKLKPKRNKIK